MIVTKLMFYYFPCQASALPPELQFQPSICVLLPPLPIPILTANVYHLLSFSSILSKGEYQKHTKHRSKVSEFSHFPLFWGRGLEYLGM
jgi:hypothetical protein